jgi:hypothetical protein
MTASATAAGYQPVIEGSDEEPTPCSGKPLKAGELVVGYPNEDGPPFCLPQTELFSHNDE